MLMRSPVLQLGLNVNQSLLDSSRSSLSHRNVWRVNEMFSERRERQRGARPSGERRRGATGSRARQGDQEGGSRTNKRGEGRGGKRGRAGTSADQEAKGGRRRRETGQEEEKEKEEKEAREGGDMVAGKHAAHKR